MVQQKWECIAWAEAGQDIQPTAPVLGTVITLAETQPALCTDSNSLWVCPKGRWPEREGHASGWPGWLPYPAGSRQH